MFGSDMIEFMESKNECVTGFNSDRLDLRQNIEVINESIKEFDVVINATAYTHVNKAESEPEKAFELNSYVPEKLAKITSANKQKLIHISTDYVFDGTKESPYLTTDKPNPINVYGQSKLAGEMEVSKHNPGALIIRTSWLYGPKGHCFPKAIITKLQQESQLSVVDDQLGTPTSTWFLRAFVLRAITDNFAGGIHHGVPTGKTSWFGFAQTIDVDDRHQIFPIKTSSQEGIAERPQHGQLEPHPSTTKSWEECWDEIRHEFLGDKNQ